VFCSSVFFSVIRPGQHGFCRDHSNSSTEYHQSAADDVATHDDANQEVPGRSTRGTEESWIYEIYRSMVSTGPRTVIAGERPRSHIKRRSLQMNLHDLAVGLPDLPDARLANRAHQERYPP
jgi:hypothetical protein